MLTIGQLSRRAQVKVPTIRFYEDRGLLPVPERTEGNQRRYDRAALERLIFVRHARDLGFSVDQILDLIDVAAHPDRPCAEVSKVVEAQRSTVRDKIARLQALERELDRIAHVCDGGGQVHDCAILQALGDHAACDGPH